MAGPASESAGRNLAEYPQRDVLRATLTVIALVAAALWVSFHLLKPAPPRHIVLVSGVAGGLYHKYALRYQAILARNHVTVEERITNGAGDNLRLLLDPNSGVDVAFMQGGVATFPAADKLVMLASLYYEPLWVFHRRSDPIDRISELAGKRLAIGAPGSGSRALIEPLLAANGLRSDSTPMLPLASVDALRALKAGEIDAAIMVGGAQTGFILAALRDPLLDVLTINRADAYERRFPHITKLTLPMGTVDLARNIPSEDVTLIGTKAMLASRDDLHPALINLLVDAAREIHGDQGYFERAGEFPDTAHVDLRVSLDADQHRRFGSSFLYRYLPFWVATFVERAIILLVPLLFVLVPALNYLPQFLRWRVRMRIYRWYGELALLERDVASRGGELPIANWLHNLDRIEHSAEQIHTPASFASEAYTLREHIALVRRRVQERISAADPPAPGPAKRTT